MDDKGTFFFGEKRGCLGKIEQQEKGRGGNKHGCDSFKDEDPTPSSKAANAVHFADTEGEKAAKGAGYRCGREEECLTKLDLMAAIPQGKIVLHEGVCQLRKKKMAWLCCKQWEDGERQEDIQQLLETNQLLLLLEITEPLPGLGNSGQGP